MMCWSCLCWQSDAGVWTGDHLRNGEQPGTAEHLLLSCSKQLLRSGAG